MATHFTDVNVRWAELDPYGHVNHAVYVGYLEVARAEALDHIGLSLANVGESGYQFVVVELNVQYKRAAEMGDRLRIETSLSATSRATSTWRQRIMRDDEVIITGSVRAAVTDRTGKAVRPPSWITEALLDLAP